MECPISFGISVNLLCPLGTDCRIATCTAIKCGPCWCIISVPKIRETLLCPLPLGSATSLWICSVNLLSYIYWINFSKCRPMNWKNLLQLTTQTWSTSCWFSSFFFYRFDLYFRKNSFGGEFIVLAGLEECIKFIANYKFTEQDIYFLQSIMPMCEVSSQPYMRIYNSLSSNGKWFFDKLLA